MSKQKAGWSRQPLKAGSITRGMPEYQAWLGIKGRCYNVKNSTYKNYGGRGITVCDRWLNSSRAFLEDMGPRPAGHSLDRIDNDKGYSPENCRWATREQQAANKRQRKINQARPSTNSNSGHVGVTWRPTVQKWQVTVNTRAPGGKNRQRSLGHYESKQLAIDVRRAWATLANYFRGRE